ncbi:MAG: hypothetical protein NXI20_25315, partial [bacterium]|nr:hypothetical protein [bacterium]
MKRLTRLIPALCLLWFGHHAFSQSMGIGIETPNQNAVLHLVSPNNDQGLMIPQLSTAQRTATSFISRLTSSDNGLLVFDVDENAFYYWHDNSWQSLRTSVNISAGTGISLIDGEISNTGDLDATNELQDISLTGTNLTISNGSTIDLSAIDTNTQLDEAAVDAFVSNNGYLTSVDLSGYDTDSSDDFDGDYSSLANAPTSLSQFTNDAGFVTSANDADADETNELITGVTLESGNILRITDAGGNNDIDLSSLQDGTGTDSQNLSFDGTNLNISGGTGIDISGWDTDATNELITSATLSGTTLTITDAGGNNDVDLSSLSTSTDSQDLSFDGTNLNISGGTGIDISGWDTDSSDDFDGAYSSLSGAPTNLSDFTNDSGFITSADDADADATNELITGASLTGTTLRITDAGGNNDVDLSTLQDGTGTDSQNLSFDGSNLNISGGTGLDVSGWDTDASDDFDGTYSALIGAPTAVTAFTNDAGYITSADDADADASNELITAASLTGTTLRITDAGGNNDVDLSSLQDGTGTDDQVASEVPVTPANGVTSTTVQAALEELQGEIAAGGGGDMLESIYDADGDNIVDDSELVNGLTVLTAVPAGAVFTDTQLEEGAVDFFVSNNGYLVASDLTGYDSDASDDFDGAYSSLTGAPTAVSAFTNDAGYITSPNDADASTTNELITAASLTGTTLRITDAGGNNDVDLSSLQDGTGTDSQNLSFDGSNLNISGGTGIDVTAWDTDASDDFNGAYSSLTGAPTVVSAFTNDAGYITSPNDADASTTNELITAASLTGTTLRITDAGGNNDVDLSTLQDGTGTDSQNLSFDGTNLNISGGTGIDISLWDTDASDDFSFPTAQSITNANPLLDLTNSGQGSAAAFSSDSDSEQTVSITSTGDNLNANATLTVNRRNSGPATTYPTDIAEFRYFDNKVVGIDEEGIHFANSGVYPATIAVDDNSSSAGRNLVIQSGFGTTSGGNIRLEAGASGEGERADVFVQASSFHMGRNEIDDNGGIRFDEEFSNGTNYVAFQAPASIASNVSWELPNADGSNGQVFTTNGSGTLSWSTVDTDNTNELLTSGGMSGNFLRLFEGSNNVNVDLSQFAELPGQSGNAGRFLTTDGSSVSWATAPSGGLWTANGSDAYFSTGSVGIGTSTPQNPLHVTETVAAVDGTDGAFIDIQNLNSNTNALAGIRFKSNTSVGSDAYKGAIFFQRGGADANAGGFGSIVFAMNNGNNLNNVTAADARMSIGTAGVSVTGNLGVTNFFTSNGTANFNGTLNANDVLNVNDELQVGNGAGTAGYVLESLGSGSSPVWQAPVWDVTYGTTDLIYLGPGIGTNRVGMG